MESFVTYDEALVCVPLDFLKSRMSNGVVPRLLGWDTPDGLTTPKPSRNNEGQLTVLKHMHIGQHAFLKLLQFLRVGHLPHEHIQEAYTASISLGGFEELDAYVRTHSKDGGPYHPMTPGEDTENTYVWTVRHMNTLDINAMKEWSVTQPVNVSNGASPMHVYLRSSRESIF